jgi:hypothetical protein
MEGSEWNILLFVGEDAQPSSSHPIVKLESSDSNDDGSKFSRCQQQWAQSDEDLFEGEVRRRIQSFVSNIENHGIHTQQSIPAIQSPHFQQTRRHSNLQDIINIEIPNVDHTSESGRL